MDDFAHHPTAIRATIEAARGRWPKRRIWAAFEPRSNTLRRNIMEVPLAESLAMADGVALGPVSRAQLLSDAERLSPERVAAKIESLGRPAAALANAEGVAEYLDGVVEPGDIVLVMSNGSFDGLLGKLMTRLSKARAPEKITRQ